MSNSPGPKKGSGGGGTKKHHTKVGPFEGQLPIFEFCVNFLVLG